MQCKICALPQKIINDIEHRLAHNGGQLFTSDFSELREAYPAYVDELNKIATKDCEMHFNFHQATMRQAPSAFANSTDPTDPTAAGASVSISNPDDSSNPSGKTGSLAEDVGKDEAAVLYQLLNQQAATFTALSRKMNDAITKSDKEAGALMVHPDTVELYSSLAASMRATVKELRELDVAKNGEKDGATEGLKMLAKALAPAPQTTEATDRRSKPSIPLRDDDMTTKEFDD